MSTSRNEATTISTRETNRWWSPIAITAIAQTVTQTTTATMAIRAVAKSVM